MITEDRITWALARLADVERQIRECDERRAALVAVAKRLTTSIEAMRAEVAPPDPEDVP